jgi:hypothetical protein
MELRRILFEFRLSRVRVAAAAHVLGHNTHEVQVGVVAQNRRPAFPSEIASIRAGLLALGVPPEIVAACPEIQPRPDHRAKNGGKRRRADGEG